MSEIFTNKIGTEIFARNLFSFNEEIPHDRFVDPEYQRLSKRSLLKDDHDEYYFPFPIRDWCKDEN